MAAPRFRIDDSATAEDGASIWDVYQPVFGDYATFDTWCAAVWEKHRVRAGFRLARAYDGDVLVGFAYGYVGADGQWWTDNARAVLAPDVADAWLGGHFELVSLGVLAGARGAGIGRRLMRAVVDGRDHERLLLMTTSDAADPARRLYASEGWRVIGPGIGEATVIMAKGTARTGAAGPVPDHDRPAPGGTDRRDGHPRRMAGDRASRDR
ncbi:GNAT family N-acetyltransferase [Jidongwangia harbinensis]|uniref:GNAT family N-acetyltransferase n=1 Tax=Jidongwangia harbinensis TaxID=2878561 RepID=UPI001CD95BAB|nr:GNAT family N-acetyltransferase [Jidongwangia harbinensis]MCA2216605.1 GNAT family N-acetyltransferase [Jidongwangia harbinensis]